MILVIVNAGSGGDGFQVVLVGFGVVAIVVFFFFFFLIFKIFFIMGLILEWVVIWF